MGQCLLRLALGDPRLDFLDLGWSESLGSSHLLPGLLSGSDALSLPLLDDRPLELGNRADDLKLELLEGIVLPGEGQVLLVEANGHASTCQLVEHPEQVLEVSCQPVDAVDMERVALPQVGHALQELWPLGVLGAGLLGEDPVQLDALKLAVRVLVDRADPDIPDLLSAHIDLLVFAKVIDLYGHCVKLVGLDLFGHDGMRPLGRSKCVRKGLPCKTYFGRDFQIATSHHIGDALGFGLGNCAEGSWLKQSLRD